MGVPGSPLPLTLPLSLPLLREGSSGTWAEVCRPGEAAGRGFVRSNAGLLRVLRDPPATAPSAVTRRES